MGVIPLLLFFVLFNPFLLYASKENELFFKKCLPFSCGNFGEIRFPFTNRTRGEICGPFVVEGCDQEVDRKIQLARGGKWYELQSISQANTISITDKEFQRHLNSNSCDSFNNFSLPSLPYAFFHITSNLTFFKCDPNVIAPQHLEFSYTSCKNFTIYYNNNTSLPSLPSNCSIVQLPVNRTMSFDDIFRLLTASFSLQMFVPFSCYERGRRGKCHRFGEKIKFINSIEGTKNLGLKLGLGLGGPSTILIISISICFIWRHRYKRKNVSSDFISANASLDPYSKSDPEGGNVYFGVPIFSYSELEEATDNFDSQKELGEGGFGTVYHGELRDGQEVAVKRLYEHNCKRVKQFMNEIEILTCLRHKNLVSLYGCTSRRSRELILVYEYIPNSTVADHLYRDRAKSGPLTWPIRMRIAIETASALTYLHASDIIHRDVKTNNILLDNNFCVKVADFGLSRLFPSDVTHISTAPQGTPGYLDPEYHQCYHLTAKSDVYSFGVVLIELISSMPAVDITRHKHEINLATLAINKIQKGAFDDLIDPYLGYNSDEEVKRMTISIAELAFLCLQHDKEIRPCMIEVLEELKTIESGGYELENLEEENGDDGASKNLDPLDCDVTALLKNTQPPPSSNSTTDKWISSGSTTPNGSSQ